MFRKSKKETKKSYFIESLKSAVTEEIQPVIKKIAIDTTRGYLFGSIFGIFAPTSRSITTSMHNTGKNFAKMSAVYSIAEMGAEKIRGKKDIYTSIYSGAIAGAIGSKNNKFVGSVIFGTYSGLSNYFGKN